MRVPARTPRPVRGGPSRPGRVAVTAVLALTVLGGCSSDPPRVTAGPPAASGSPATTPAAGTPHAGMPTWAPAGALQTPRDDFVTAVVDGEIWVLGGMTGDRGNRLTSIEVYDPSTQVWTTSDVEMPVGLASFEGAAVGDRIFVFGGLDASSRPTDFSAVLDTSTGTWRRLSPLPHARYAHTVTLHEGRIHVIGGESVAGAVPEVDVFDTASMTWSSGTPMPLARGSHDTVSTPAALYVLGGWLDGGPSRLVQVYEPSTGTWTDGPALPQPVSRGGAAVLDGVMWVSFHEFAAALDLDTGDWAPANHPPLSRHGHGFVALHGAVYAIGGCRESPLRDVRTVDVMAP